MIYDLTAYVHHAERFGPECVLETAAGDLSRDDLGKLKAFIDSKERTFRWKNGQWVERREGGRRQCEHCGLDLPPGTSIQARYHKHCKGTAKKRRRHARNMVGAPQAGGVPPIASEVGGSPGLGAHPGATGA